MESENDGEIFGSDEMMTMKKMINRHQNVRNDDTVKSIDGKTYSHQNKKK